MSTLDQWEAEAKEVSGNPDPSLHPYSYCEASYRIHALIDLVRKKDEVLELIEPIMIRANAVLYVGLIEESFALTEELK